MAKEKVEKQASRRRAPSGASSLEAASNINKIAAIEAEQRAAGGLSQRAAEAIANVCGSITFVYVHVLMFGTWICLNTFTERFRVDPFPFTFLTLLVSLEAIFISIFILISQNHETRLTERRSHLDLQINLLAEQESTKTLELLQLVAKRIGIECEDEEATKALLEPVDPQALVDAIVEVSSPEITAASLKTSAARAA